MDTMIKDVNSSLQEIIDNLAELKDASAGVLNEVELKITEKNDEAKVYKGEVEDNKERIKDLESEIKDLESDLEDLNSRFSKKDLDAIVETGNREINAKITEKHGEITKHRQKIGELTEKGRSIKELLTSLKKDKTSKEQKLETITTIFNYYNESLGKIIQFAEENPNSLEAFRPVYSEEIEDDTETVFEDIIEKTPTDEAFSSINNKLDEPLIEEDTEEDNILSKLQVKTGDFDELNNMQADFDEDFFENLSSNDLDLIEEVSNSNVFADSIKENDKKTFEEFLKENNLDINRFNTEFINNIKPAFNSVNAKKVLDILKENNIDLEAVYDGGYILAVNSEDVNQILTKLLLANQTTLNIGLVLCALWAVNLKKLEETINNYGADIKEANITDIVLKSLTDEVVVNLDYIYNLGYNIDEINSMMNRLPSSTIDALSAFPKIVEINYASLNKYNIKNIKEVFTGYAHMFLLNPDKFDAILDKYDPEDLVRCLEKNAAVIEKL